MKLVHWQLMVGLLHLVQRGEDWTAQDPPRCTKYNSPPISGQCTNHRKATDHYTAILLLYNGPLPCGFNVKEVDLNSAFIVVPHTQGGQERITQFYLQITPHLPLPRKHSPDGASSD